MATTISTNDIREKAVTSSKLSDDITITRDLVVTRNLYVNGTTTEINTTNLSVGDNIIVLNDNVETGAPTLDAGIEVRRGDELNALLLWNETSDYWETAFRDGFDKVSGKRLVDETYGDSRYVNQTGDTMTGSLAINVQGLGAFDILKINQYSQDINIWKVTDNNTDANAFFLTYKGSATTNDKALELWAHNQASSNRRVYQVLQDGNILFDQNVTITGDLLAANYTGNLSFFDTATDGTNSYSATTSLKNIKFQGSGGAAVTLSTDASNAAIVTVNTAHNHDATYVKLTNMTGQTINGDLTLANNVTVSGNLTVSGTTTTINTQQLSVADNMITLNSDLVDAPTENSGLEINRGTLASRYMIWDEANDRFDFNDHLNVQGQLSISGVRKDADWDTAYTRTGGTTSRLDQAVLTTSSPTFITVTAALNGNASTATILQTTRTIAIGGKVTGTATSFNGSANITINATAVTDAAKWTTARTLSLTGSVTGSASIDGSGNVSITTTTNHTHAYDNYGNWKLQAAGGATVDITTGSTVNIEGSGIITVTRTGNTISIAAAIGGETQATVFTFATAGVQTFTHNLNTTAYAVIISTDSPQRHVYYTNKTLNSVDINLDDDPYEATIEVSVIIMKTS